ncbi:MAG: DUF692 family multinuclear iron-containing protein, partial [Polyangiaceae bacterium]
NLGKYIIDTHRGPIIDPVWELYGALIERTGPVSTLIEWDDQIPDWAVLEAEVSRARTVRDAALARRSEGQRSGVARVEACEARTRDSGAPTYDLRHGGPRERAADERGALDP